MTNTRSDIGCPPDSKNNGDGLLTIRPSRVVVALKFVKIGPGALYHHKSALGGVRIRLAVRFEEAFRYQALR
jgi:hypothetical protein